MMGRRGRSRRSLACTVVGVLAAAITSTPALTARAEQPALAGVPAGALRHAAQVAAPSLVEVDMELTGALRNRADAGIGDVLQLGFSGTGFFASSDGVVVTAAHVAAPTAQQIHEALVDAQIDIDHKCTRTTTEACDSVEQQFRAQMLRETEAVDTNTTLHILTQDDSSGDGLPAQLLTSSASDVTDVAVLKVDMHDAPVLALATSAPALDSPLAVIGYPESNANSTTATVPVVTTGTIHDVRPGDPGFAAAATVLETDAHIEHGDSGGPGVDPTGAAVGIVSYGPSADRNFLVSAHDVIAALHDAGAVNALGAIDHLWRDGLDAAVRGDTATAVRLLQQCADLNPVQTGCRDQAALLTGQPTLTPRPRSGTVAQSVVQRDAAVATLAVGMAIGLVLGVCGTLLVVRLRRKTPPPPSGTPADRGGALWPWMPPPGADPPAGG